jgi:hypothetical protein
MRMVSEDNVNFSTSGSGNCKKGDEISFLEMFQAFFVKHGIISDAEIDS